MIHVPPAVAQQQIPVGAFYENSTNANNGNNIQTSFSIPFPSGINDSSLLLAHMNGSNGVGSWNTPTGWNLIQRDTRIGNGSGLFWRAADGLESGSQTFTVSSGGRLAGQMWRISGADTTTPVNDNSYYHDTTDLSTYVLNSITTTVGGCLGAYFGNYLLGGWVAHNTHQPSGYTEVQDFVGAYISCCSGVKDDNLGAAGTKNLTITRDQISGTQYFGGYFIAIAPA